MSYKYDHYLTIANKYSTASSDAKAELFETYDQLRDITVSGSNATGGGFGVTGNFLWQLANIFAPSTFMSVMGGTETMNIPGTSYWSPVTGTTSSIDGGNSAFGLGSLSKYPGFPSGAASVLGGFGLKGTTTGGAAGLATGYAASLSADGAPTGYAVSSAGIAALNTAAYAAGTTSGFSIGKNIVLPTAGLVSGFGGILQSLAPYMGTYGVGAVVAGNLLQGTGNAAVTAYQNITGNITSNADVILENRVANIETICKMLDTQGDVVRQFLKDGIEGDKKDVQAMAQSG